jgi:molybdenum cofactor cytidylyltransferase
MAGMIAAVILAAGASTRMGAHKLLLPLGGEPIVRRTVRQVVGAGFDDVVVVVGFERERVVSAIDDLPVRPVVNQEYARGMGTSFRAAVGALGEASAAMFALADQPFVGVAEYRRVIDAYRATAPAIVSVRYGEVTAPPHLFACELFGELSQLEQGARPVLQRHRDRTVVLQFDPGLLLDVDTPADYERAKRRVPPA